MAATMEEQHADGRVFAYRPALDGVRGLAVAAVVAFHGGVPGIDGGFLGVDAFFVLSGYLITSLLLAEYDRNGRIGLVAFWGRRARRLLPALLLVLTAVAVAGRYLLESGDLRLLRGDALAAAGYVANWRMIYRGSDYFAQTSTPSPLQHTWSLGIEEQFYVLWPLIVVGLLAAFTARRARRVLLVLCAVGTAGSAAAAWLLYRPGDVNRAYFGTDSRAQALLIGCGLAVLLIHTGRSGRGRHPVLGALAVAGVAGTAWLWTHASGTGVLLYRGGFAAGALAVAAVLAHAVVSPASPTARVLSAPPLVWLGRISYGVYLWHWPLFQFVTAQATHLSGVALLAVRCTLTLLVAVVSFVLVERPIRRATWLRRRPARLSAGLAAAGSALTCGVVLIATVVPSEGTAPPVVVALPRAPSAPPSATRAAPTAPSAVPPMNRPGRNPGAQPRIDVFGDSVAWTLGTYLPPHPGLAVANRAIQGCGITLQSDILELGGPHRLYPYCPSWPDRWRGGVDGDDPDVAVILLNRWELMDARIGGSYQHVGQPGFDAYLLGQLDQAVGIAGARGARVVLLTAAYTRRSERPDGGLYDEDQPGRVDAWNALLRQEAARHRGTVDVLDLNHLVCPDGGFTWRVDGVRVRSDGLHFTPAGVQKVIAPWLLPQLAAIAQTGSPGS